MNVFIVQFILNCFLSDNKNSLEKKYEKIYELALILYVYEFHFIKKNLSVYVYVHETIHIYIHICMNDSDLH